MAIENPIFNRKYIFKGFVFQPAMLVCRYVRLSIFDLHSERQAKHVLNDNDDWVLRKKKTRDASLRRDSNWGRVINWVGVYRVVTSFQPEIEIYKYISIQLNQNPPHKKKILDFPWSSHFTKNFRYLKRRYWTLFTAIWWTLAALNCRYITHHHFTLQKKPLSIPTAWKRRARRLMVESMPSQTEFKRITNLCMATLTWRIIPII